MKRYLFLGISLLFFFSCSQKEHLDKESVLQSEQSGNTDLDQWIVSNYVKRYNIDVEYRFAQQSAFDDNLLYAPNLLVVKPVIEAIQVMGIDLFEQELGEGIKSVLPLYIRLYGGVNYVDEKIERMSIPNGSSVRFTLFRLNDFVAKEEQSALRLMRNFFNNYAKLLIWKKPYDRVAFEKLNYLPYRKNIRPGEDIYDLSSIPGGYFSVSAARFDADEDFAETLSVLLSFSPTQIDEMIRQAGVPVSDDVKDRANAAMYQSVLKQKRQFVTDYLKKEYHLDLYRLSYLSLEKRQAYLK